MMQLLVLGYVPGTNIQINFGFFAAIMSIFAVLYLANLLYKEEQIKKADKRRKTIEYKTIFYELNSKIENTINRLKTQAK